MTRSSLLSVLLIVAIGLVLTKTYWLWTTGPWDLPNPGKAKSPILVEGSKPVTNPPAVIGTETVISKNIFDPERGAGFTREAEANPQAFQRIRSMVLLGTAILGNNRFAILQDGAISSGAPGVPGQSAAPMRIKLGDTVEGFRLSEVSEKRVVFARGTSTVIFRAVAIIPLGIPYWRPALNMVSVNRLHWSLLSLVDGLKPKRSPMRCRNPAR